MGGSSSAAWSASAAGNAATLGNASTSAGPGRGSGCRYSSTGTVYASCGVPMLKLSYGSGVSLLKEQFQRSKSLVPGRYPDLGDGSSRAPGSAAAGEPRQGQDEDRGQQPAKQRRGVEPPLHERAVAEAGVGIPGRALVERDQRDHRVDGVQHRVEAADLPAAAGVGVCDGRGGTLAAAVRCGPVRAVHQAG